MKYIACNAEGEGYKSLNTLCSTHCAPSTDISKKGTFKCSSCASAPLSPLENVILELAKLLFNCFDTIPGTEEQGQVRYV